MIPARTDSAMAPPTMEPKKFALEPASNKPGERKANKCHRLGNLSGFFSDKLKPESVSALPAKAGQQNRKLPM